ncbi:hypothetical protein FNV43_RR01795 [Rhamnella rubrinervis]|uniref:Uncharacterized protein n=1 Tax=Rhamnella rubrinervis TaxID=2594499 RepID=A0A8K0HSX8_9ROSA|nr:hypothetical protein FNV43_RR01795 [Rhamnella rubrinervis]
MFSRRGITLVCKLKPHFLSGTSYSCSKPSSTVVNKKGEVVTRLVPVANYCSKLNLYPLFPDAKPHSNGYDIELVDHDAWRVSSGLAQAWRGMDAAARETSSLSEELVDDCSPPGKEDPDFDDIDNMRIRGNLFYKLDRNSKEFEEYNFDFHREKKLPKVVNNKCSLMAPMDEIKSTCAGKKKLRVPTFNQLTGPYHEPFCLDIYLSKASVRACIVHRVTSKVVVVAHSISKDMKFDLASTRDSAACAAVGAVLAQRALGDDIHDVVYTPRKGERLEGKLQFVLQSIIDNGINVKVKVKQRRAKKPSLLSVSGA